jgi:hypothetical protein
VGRNAQCRRVQRQARRAQTTGSPPRGWVVCSGIEIMHRDDRSECSLVDESECVGLDELHEMTVSCAVVPAEDRDGLTHRCADCS